MSTDMIARAEAWLAAHHPDEAAAIIRDLLEVARLSQPAPLTVGAALALPQVQDGSHVVEYMRGTVPSQLGHHGARVFGVSWRTVDRPIWIDEYAWPCRLVPVAHADADPSTRGPL